MDQNDSLLEIETTKSKKSNEYFLFIKKTLQFLVPVSLLSFLITYASGFSFIFTCNFHFSTLVFPLFSHALERKYMFLVCNGILAILAKTLSFNSSSPSATDFIHEEPIKSTEDNVKPISETVLVEEVSVLSATSENVAPADEEEEKEEQQEVEEKVYVTSSRSRYAEYEHQAKGPGEGKEGKFLTGSSLIIESAQDLYGEEEEEEEADDETEESVSVLGTSVAEEGNEVNLNTEELNHKFEEFIRKMKEEIRIEAQQQLVVA